MTAGDQESAVAYVEEALSRAGNPEKAAGMQAYMRTEMPFYGVQKPARTPILRQLVHDFPPVDRDGYQALVLRLWNLPHREEKYLALGVAQHFLEFVDTVSLPLYRRLIVEGAWWDLVDEVATHLIRHLVMNHPNETWPEVDTWIEDPDMWL
ncbi:MAG TPA: DNA alkylation repair protein, partial [Acidimicrobiia bacterium]|nr:DNA alkylation repair protein [Acidimicrobiia bacterium]